MSKKILLKIVTPEKSLVDQEVDSLSLETTQGQITILPGHADLVATLVPGEAHTVNGLDEKAFHVAGGFVKIVHTSGATTVTVLADAAEHFDEISEERALEAQKKAEEQLANTAALSEEEIAAVTASLNRSLARLRIARKHSKRATNTIN